MAQKFKIAARSPLMANILAGDTSLTVDITKADLFPVADTNTSSIPTVGKDWFKIVLEDSSHNIEIVYVRTRALGSASMTNLLRGQEGTTARSYLAGSIVGLRHTADDLANAIDLASSTTSFWKSILGLATQALSRTALGITAIGDAVFTATSAAAARAALGSTAAGDAVFTATSAAAARAALGSTAAGDAVFTASTAAVAYNSIKQSATESATGAIQIATIGESTTGTNAVKCLTPYTLRTGLNAPVGAPIYACRAWCFFSGTGTPAIMASGNVSSITDNGVGDYSLNYITALQDANGVSNVSVRQNTAYTALAYVFFQGGSFVRIQTKTNDSLGESGNPALADNDTIYVSTFR